jgi:hypothetical protein
MAFGPQLLDPTASGTGQTRASARVAPSVSESRQASVIEAALVPADRAGRAAKRAGHLALIRPAAGDQIDHRVRLGHPIRHRILGQDHPGNEHHAMSVPRSQEAPLVNRTGVFGVPSLREKVFTEPLRHHARRYTQMEKADRFGFALVGVPSGPS